MAEQLAEVRLATKRLHRASKNEEPKAYGPGLVTVPVSVAEQWGVDFEIVRPTPTKIKKASDE
jgi:hypothetical protein